MSQSRGKSDKQRIRAHWNAQRDFWSRNQSNASKDVREHVSRTNAFIAARQIGLYAARSFEIDVSLLWHARPENSYFPITLVEKNELQFYKVPALDTLKKNAVGIMEPHPERDLRASLWTPGDLVLVPGIVFDRRGNRLGSGMGYYDRLLASLPKGIHIWGIAFDEQISQEPLPTDPWDIVMQKIVSPSGIIECSPPDKK